MFLIHVVQTIKFCPKKKSSVGLLFFQDDEKDVLFVSFVLIIYRKQFFSPMWIQLSWQKEQESKSWVKNLAGAYELSTELVSPCWLMQIFLQIVFSYKLNGVKSEVHRNNSNSVTISVSGKSRLVIQGYEEWHIIQITLKKYETNSTAWRFYSLNHKT